MKVLLVEDEDLSIQVARRSLSRVGKDIELDIAKDRDSAIEAIEREQYDLIICDLRIPPNDRSVDIDESHGLAVHGAARGIAPGTPLIFLTGFSTSDTTRRQLSAGGTRDLYGKRNHSMVQLVDKDNTERLEEVVAEVYDALKSLSACAVVSTQSVHPLFSRGVQSYAALTGHERAHVETTAGLSGANVGRVQLESYSQASATIILKVLNFNDASNEFDRYKTLVANRLAPATFAPTVICIDAGLGSNSALVSTLAGEGFTPLFDVLRDSPSDATRAVELLRNSLAPWHDNPTRCETTLHSLRAELCTEEKAALFEGDPDRLRELEDVSISMMRLIAHGDLHGSNILVDQSGRPLLIDFGDVGIGYAPTDPVTLELSPVFHTQGPWRDPDLIAQIRWECWPEVAACYPSGHLRDFASACREWASELSSTRETLAYAYAHSMKQLKYSDVDDSVALAIAHAARAAL